LQARQVVGAQVGNAQPDLGNRREKHQRRTDQDDGLPPGKGAPGLVVRYQRSVSQGRLIGAQSHVLRCLA
jgi:hypothetical protein